MQRANEDFRISPAKNGYIVDVSWNEGEDFKYKSERHIFPTWEGIVDWVKNNKLEG